MSEKLAAPAQVQAVPRDNAVLVRWSPVEGADGYILYFYKSDEPQKCIKKRYAQKNSKQLLGFFNGVDYLVTVCGFYYENGAECEGAFSEKVSFSPISETLKAEKVICISSGKTAQINWEYLNEKPDAEFKSDNEAVAVVDKKGVVRGVSAGAASIRITAAGQEFITKVYVNRKQPESPRKAVLLFTGDLMCAVAHQRRGAQRQFDFCDSFNAVRRILSEADFVTGVLETTCYDRVPYEFEKLRLESGAPNCNSPTSFISAAADAGFDMLVTANNHNCDTGTAGLVATVGSIERYGMKSLGALGNNPVINTINGIRVAFIAVSMISNGQEKLAPELNDEAIGRYSREYFERLVRESKNAGAEFIVAYQHWGGMNSSAVRKNQLDEAEFMAECGADLIVGSHPHVLQKFTYIRTLDGRNVPCAFSLGNFISSQAELSENRDTAVLRVELSKEKKNINAWLSYIPCISADSDYGVTVQPLVSHYDEASKEALKRIREAIGDEIDTFSYRPTVLLCGSLILERIFSAGDIANINKAPMLLSQLSACGEPREYGGKMNELKLDITKDFPYYIKDCGADYAAVDFYTAAGLSCYKRGKEVYTGTKRFLNSEFYLENKDEFTRIKPPFEEEFWKPRLKKYAEALLDAFPSERIILFRHYFSDKFLKGGTELRNTARRGSLNRQLAEMEKYFISLVNPAVVNISKHYFSVGSSPSNYEKAYFVDACRACEKIMTSHRRCIDTPDLDMWYERVLECYENMSARSYQSWLLDMKNAADVIIAYTSKAFAAENKERLLKLRLCGSGSVSGAADFFAGDYGAEKITAAAEIIAAVLSGDISKPYDFYAPAFKGNFNILKKMAKLLSEELGIPVSCENAERVFLLKNRPDKLGQYISQLKDRTVDIWGSCVTREIFNSCKKAAVGTYIFKQCPVLINDKPVPAAVPEEASAFCGNGWRRRTVADAFSRNGMQLLRSKKSKWIAVDFYDVICEMNEYKGELFEVDDFIMRTDFYKSIKSECVPCRLFERRTKEQLKEAITRFSWNIINLYGDNIILVKTDPKDSFITLDNRIEKMKPDPDFNRKRELIGFCEELFEELTGCYVIDLSKHFMASDKFPLGGAHIVHYEQEFYYEAGVYLSHILKGSKLRRFDKPDENYLTLRNLRLER